LPKPFKDKTLPLSSTLDNLPHQAQLLPANQSPKKLPNNKLKRTIKKEKKKPRQHQKNKKRKEEWEDYLIEIFKLYIYSFLDPYLDIICRYHKYFG